ncbi:MAG TPA: sialidase family protein, partial [Gemmataceae bacterium]
MNRSKLGLLAVLVIGGAAGGVYLSGRGSSEPQPTAAPSEPDAPRVAARFPLSTFDAKDTVEAPDITIGPDGGINVAWGSKTAAAERSVFFTRSVDGGQSFDSPRAVSKAGIYRSASKESKGGYERRASPHVAVQGESIALSWSEALPDRSAMRMVVAASTDGGRSFADSQPVHSGAKANPTFTAMAAGPDGSLACAWLDDRRGVQEPYAAVRRMPTASFEPEIVVHPEGVCPCCPVAACFGPDGTLYVAFRNIHDGYRDIAICRKKKDQAAFEGPFPVASNAWKFDGCPHDGPSLVAIGNTIRVAWMDARSGPQRCYYARANGADMKFETRELHPNAPGTQGNAKLIADGLGGLYAAWEESLGVEPIADAGHHHGPPKLGGSGRAIMLAHMPA